MVVLIANLDTADSDYQLDNVNYWLPDITAARKELWDIATPMAKSFGFPQ